MSSLAERALQLAYARRDRGEPLALRAQGVVPTPPALARAALARADRLLREGLQLEEGIASERVVVIDPAVGTGVWLAALLEHTAAAPRGARELIGIDLDGDSLAEVEQLLAHECSGRGVTLSLWRANTLALAHAVPASDDRVRVIIGNPPWAARSLSRGTALSDGWLAEFRRDHAGVSLGERRAGVLSDDYVRFYRWALEQARTAPAGALVCFASNASFLDGPVHRGMRAALVRAFDRIEVVDLGGNALLSSGAESDENVFGVRVGSALTWALRRPGARERSAVATYRRLRGGREQKLAALSLAEQTTTHTPLSPWFRLRPLASARAVDEGDGFSLAEAFPFHREGVQTNRDALCTAASEAVLLQQVEGFARGELAVSASRHFDPARVSAIVADALARGALPVAELAYRPLQRRYFVPLPPLCHRPRPELLRAVARSSLCLLSVRKERGAAPYNLFAATRAPADACFLSVHSSCRTRVFPSHGPEGEDNLAPRVREQLARRLGEDVDARAVLLFALGTLGSPRFRADFDEALKCDYPRLPWPRDAATFAQTAVVGEQFVAALTADAPIFAPCVVQGELSERIAPASLRYVERARTIEQDGRALLAEVQPAHFQVAIGHHALVRSALSGCAAPTIAELVAALGRAALWADAEQAADALWAPEVRVDSAGRSA